MNNISALIIAYNDPALLSKCLSSLQECPAIDEILIFDNFSYSDVIQNNDLLIKQLSKKKAIKVEHAIKDQSLSYIYNWAISHSKNDVLLICDSDIELMSPHSFDSCLEVFKMDPTLAVQGFLCQSTNPSLINILSPFYLNHDKMKSREPLSIAKSALSTWNPSAFPSILRHCFCIRKQAFTFKDSHWYGCDLLHYLLDCLVHKKKIHVRTDLFFKHNQSPWRKQRKNKSGVWRKRELHSHETFLKKALFHPILLWTLLFNNKA